MQAVYSLTNEVAPFVHYICPCSRKFIIEEMYFCLKCNKAQCKFCLQDEMSSFFCKNCLDVQQPTEAAANKNRCARTMQCPKCSSIMSIMMTKLSAIRSLNKPDKEDQRQVFLSLSSGITISVISVTGTLQRLST